MLPSLLLLTQTMSAPAHVGDGRPLTDPMRPVSRITRNSFTLQYYTATPTETIVEFREGQIPTTAFGRKPDGIIRQAQGSSGKGTWHEVEVKGLLPGKRYFYRIWDPGAKPTSQEKNWGAEGGWRREFAVSTLAPQGSKTIIHLPVKVLLMPNVINIESGQEAGVPKPGKITKAELDKIKNEFRVSSRFFWVNSGMRLWVDYQFFVDERWQRWGPEPANVDPFYKGWPASRSWPNKDYEGPGGGDFTVLDTKDPLRVTKEPVVEARPYSHQVEMAWTRRWNKQAKKWEFYNSGGGTYGVDSFPQGFPGRSQFLGGGDTAWLATHETHHSLESHGAFSLSNREDERIVFNHYTVRRRVARPDGTVDEVDWTTSGRHGEHWDGMAFWDRTLSDAQWLRMYFGYTVTVRDADGDGFPDEDVRLPLDEKRFGSSPAMPQTDGSMGDLQKAMLSTWAPGPLQASWIKPPFQAILPKAKAADSDGDGVVDGLDAAPLYPYKPLVYPVRGEVDGNVAEWSGVPIGGLMNKGGMRVAFKQGHDEAGYYGMVRIVGPWKKLIVTHDGEGLGVYSGVGIQGFELTNGDVPEVKTTFGGAPGLKWKAVRTGDATDIEYSLPNRGDGMWYWTRGGREIGTALVVQDPANRLFSMYEPYRFFYCLMVERHGRAEMPSGAPGELAAADATVLRPAAESVRLGHGWVAEDGVWKFKGIDEAPLWIEGLSAKDFDLWIQIEAAQDAILGAFVKGQAEMNGGRDYIAFVGGYGNKSTRMRLFGREEGDEALSMTPGKHTMQMSRRSGYVWLLFDGKPVLWALDPNPKVIVDRLSVLGGYGGGQIVHEIRYRVR